MPTAAAGNAAPCPERIGIAGVADQRAVIEREWFAQGGRTGGGIIATMEALPASRSWKGVQIHETLQFDPAASDCPLPNPEKICGTGGNVLFVIGARGDGVRLPIARTIVPWNAGENPNNSFPDAHLVLDGGDVTPGGVDLLGVLATGQRACTITCRQTYTCGAGPARVAYGPFTITYGFRHEHYDPPLPNGRPNPLGSAVAITRVDVTKR